MVAVVLHENRDQIGEARIELGGLTKKMDALAGDVKDLKAAQRENTGTT